MAEVNRTLAHARKLGTLSREEERSVTHGDFWVPEAERELYKEALGALNAAGIAYVVAGAYAIYEHTGIYRETKDLDIFVEPTHLVSAMRALKSAGMKARLEQPHWLAKATCGELFIDIIFGMGNGLAMIDGDWYRHSRPAILAATPVRVAPAEELLWHRLFISERHRQDMADIVHLIVCVGRDMDWKRLVAKTAENWPLLLAQIQMFDYVYPEHRDGVPRWVREELLARARVEIGSRAHRRARHARAAHLALQLHDRRARVGDARPAGGDRESRARAAARARDRAQRRMGRAEHSGGGISRNDGTIDRPARSRTGTSAECRTPRKPGTVRIAAVGDFHCGSDDVGLYRELFARVNEEADVLVLTGRSHALGRALRIQGGRRRARGCDGPDRRGARQSRLRDRRRGGGESHPSRTRRAPALRRHVRAQLEPLGLRG